MKYEVRDLFRRTLSEEPGTREEQFATRAPTGWEETSQHKLFFTGGSETGIASAGARDNFVLRKRIYDFIFQKGLRDR